MFQLSETSLHMGHAGVERGSTCHTAGIIATVRCVCVCVCVCTWLSYIHV